jgi:hypothetical protein
MSVHQKLTENQIQVPHGHRQNIACVEHLHKTLGQTDERALNVG